MNLKPLKPKLFNKKENYYRVHHDEEDAVQILSAKIAEMIPSKSPRPIAIVNIGTDRSTGDSLGPLIGTFLQEKAPANFHVYGTLDDPVHAVNLDEKLTHIKKDLVMPYIIGIDACLGRLKSVGVITLGEGPVKPGAGVNKELPDVGDIHLTGIVNVSGFMEFFVLQNTRLSLVMKMARSIADSLYEADQIIQKKKNMERLQLKSRMAARSVK
ncbi:spore protease YyaC [Bacillus marinisedimentorum]|uniref:spore protease YyaC n=1 Tax=Bacillus marinisedimentorum TaxID=1821260 RepID=UPI00087213B0|nr:spore protease YyaC [Bacillus marinisedimentorum]